MISNEFLDRLIEIYLLKRGVCEFQNIDHSDDLSGFVHDRQIEIMSI